MLNHYTYLNENTTKWVSFVHGAGGSSSIWFRQIRAFKKEFNILKIWIRKKSNDKILNYSTDFINSENMLYKKN